MVRCPACGKEMRSIGSGPFPIYGCDACFGALIPFRKLASLIQAPHLLKIAAVTEATAKRGKKICPTCRKWMLIESLMNRVGTYELDICPPCAAVWFDAGELAQAPIVPDVIDQTEVTMKKVDAVLEAMYENRYGKVPFQLDRADFNPKQYYWAQMLEILLRDDPDAKQAQTEKRRGKIE